LSKVPQGTNKSVHGITLKNTDALVKPMSCVQQCNAFSFNCVWSREPYLLNNLVLHMQFDDALLNCHDSGLS